MGIREITERLHGVFLPRREGFWVLLLTVFPLFLYTGALYRRTIAKSKTGPLLSHAETQRVFWETTYS